jgi:hypothetical protein
MNAFKVNIEIHIKDLGEYKSLFSQWISDYDKEWKKSNVGLPIWEYPVEGSETLETKTLIGVPRVFLKVLEEKGIIYKEI